MMKCLRLAPALIIFFGVALMSPKASTAVVIDFWTTENQPDRLAVIGYIVDVFEALNDGVTVEVTAVADNELLARFTKACAEGETPSLVNADSELVVALGEMGYLDQSAATAVLSSIGEERFYGGALAALKADGEAWHGLPFNGWVQGVWYRKDWFEQAGLDPPKDLAGLLKAARRLHDPENGRYGVVIGTKPDHYAEQVFTQIALAKGAAMFGPDGGLAFDSPRMAEALAYYAELARYTPPGPQTWRARDFYLQGRLAMLFYSSFLMDDLALPASAANSLTGENFAQLEGAAYDPMLVSNTGMVPVLKGRRKSSYGAVSALGICNGFTGEQGEVVRRFVAFLYDRQTYITWLHMAPGGMLPVLKGMADDDGFMRDPAGVFGVYGHGVVRDVILGLEQTENFAQGRSGLYERAALVFANKIIPQMIHQTVFEGLAPGRAVRQAHDKMADLLETSRQ